MFKNYLKTAFRSILRHKGYTFINITGLALGMAACLLIMLWVLDELGYDRYHEKIESIYRVEQEQNYSGEIYHVNVTPHPMGPGIEEEIPEIVESARHAWIGTLLLRFGDNAFFEDGVRAVDPSFLTMFTFPLVRGDAQTVLEQPHSLVITEEIAMKYFGEEDPIGQTIELNNAYDFTVTGVLRNIPNNSSYRFDALLPFNFLRELGEYYDSWGSNSIMTFVQLHDQAVVSHVNDLITEIRYNHVAESIEDPEDLQSFSEAPRTLFMLRPFMDIHLHGFFGYTSSSSAVLYVIIFGVIGLFVLLIACINFMNLSTARSGNRAKEVGLRKVVGAQKSQIVTQFYSETILLSCISLIFAVVLVILLLPVFNTFSGKELSLAVLLDWKFILGMCSITLLTGLVSGSYPAIFLSAFKPVKVLKGTLAGTKGAFFRKVLVVAQFTISILLIIGTVIIFNQVNFMRSMKLGYDNEHLVYLPLRGDSRTFYDAVKTKLLTSPHIVNVSGTDHPPTRIGSNSGGADWDGKDPELNVLISQNAVEFDYIQTMKIEMVEGRSFSKQFTTDTATAFMVNEEVVRVMGVESAVDKRFSFFGIEGTIIGVFKNYHYASVQYDIEPLALYARPERNNYMVIRLAAGNTEKALDEVKTTWETMVPHYPFDYRFVEADFDRMYRSEERMGDLLRAFTILAVVIASLGLFGLASYTAEQRTKEIGVRKVLGASVFHIVFIFSREFTKWVIVANLLAWPVAYFVMKSWLQSFAYRTGIGWLVFAGTGALAIGVALLTVSYQTIKAALINPAKALKYE